MGAAAPDPILDEELPGGAARSLRCLRGSGLTLTDLTGGGNVSALLYSAAGPLERYCMPDTLKAQHISRLTAGVALYSDMGRVLASIVEDSCGWHDPIGGHSTPAILTQRWGANTYQEARNEWRRSAREAFLIELAKHGLGARDLMANINFFSKVGVDEQGSIALQEDNSAAGGSVRLRFEIDTLVILCNTPHPLAGEWRPGPVRMEIDTVAPAGPEDAVRVSCPENERGFAVTEAALA